MKFIRNVLAVVVGVFISAGLWYVLMLALFGIWVRVFENKRLSEIQSNTILSLDLGGHFSEYERDDYGFLFALRGDSESRFDDRKGLLNIVNALRRASEDDRVVGLSLSARDYYYGLGFARSGELYEALRLFKSKGKTLYGYATSMPEGAYRFFSLADTLMMHPHGSFEFNGMSLRAMYIGGLLKQWKIRPHVFRTGDYKTAGNFFTEEGMSVSEREQLGVLLREIYGSYLGDISEARGISLERLRLWADTSAVGQSVEAEALGLVDILGYISDYKRAVYGEGGVSGGERNRLTCSEYAVLSGREGGEFYEDEISVLIAEGGIVYEGDDYRQVTVGYLSSELRRLRERESTKAIVLRINSPGGGFLASDELWEEIRRTALEKPVIASLSNVAASGGYYLAMACDAIVSSPSTITGSIGAITMYFQVDALASEHGIVVDTLSTGRWADSGNPFRPLRAEESAQIQARIQEVYDVFVDKVAERRSLEKEEVRGYAQGRIWSGEAARSRNMVDTVGYLGDAVKIAAAQAGLEKGQYEVRYWRAKRSLIDVFRTALLDLLSVSSASLFMQALGVDLPLWHGLESGLSSSHLPNHKSIDLRYPYILHIEE